MGGPRLAGKGLGEGPNNEASLRRYHGWTIVFALGTTTIVSYGTSQYLIGVLVTPIAREFGWDKAAINGAYSLAVLISGLLGFGLGPALDRFGARVLMSAGSVTLATTLILLSRVNTLAEFYGLWGIGFGLGTALTYYPVSFTVIANWFETRRMNALSILTFMGAFSSTLFYPLNGALVEAFGWRETVVILGIIQLVVTLPLHALVIRRHPEDLGLRPDGIGADERPQPATGMPLSLALRARTFWLITTAYSLSFFATTTVLVEHIAFLISRGLAATLVTAIVGLFGIAYLPGRLVVAMLAPKLPLQKLVVGALVLEAAGVALLVNAHSALTVGIYVLVFGAAYGALSPLRGAMMAEHFGRRAYGAITAAQGIPIGILSALGPFVGGFLIDVVGYVPSFALCIVLLAVGAAVMLVQMPLPPRTSTLA